MPTNASRQAISPNKNNNVQGHSELLDSNVSNENNDNNN